MLEIHENMLVEAVVADELESFSPLVVPPGDELSRINIYDELDDPSDELDKTGDILSMMDLSNEDDLSSAGRDGTLQYYPHVVLRQPSTLAWLTHEEEDFSFDYSVGRPSPKRSRDVLDDDCIEEDLSLSTSVSQSQAQASLSLGLNEKSRGSWSMSLGGLTEV